MQTGAVGAAVAAGSAGGAGGCGRDIARDQRRQDRRPGPAGDRIPSVVHARLLRLIRISVRPDHPVLLALEVLHEVERILLGDGRPELAAQLPLDPTEQVELGVIGLQDAIPGRLGDLLLVEGSHELRRDQDDRLGLDRLDGVAAEPGADQRQVAQARDARRGGVGRELEQPGDRQGLALAQLDDGPRGCAA